MTNFLKTLLVLFLLLSLWVTPGPAVRAQNDSPQQETYDAQAQELLQQMSAEERVGQLFLITFPGTDTDRSDVVSELILQYKVGGVLLLAENDNFDTVGDDLPSHVADLSNRLQQIAMLGETAFVTDTVSSATTTPVLQAPQEGTALPLFVASMQEGDGPPFSEIRSGVTPLPSPMAIGASWNPSYAEEIGRILGGELSALGVNLVMGPSLDVLENPDPDRPSDLGVRTFGGDPYWVGLMGKAYTRGLHSGSQGRVAVVPKHFPGRGSSDRPLDEEVSTVRKSLEQLKQVELAPFFAVTGDAPGGASTVDAMLVTHIRYQGFQGNLRDTTAPVSLDPPALQSLMSLADFASWREAGGLLVSDSLGVRAVQRFYDNSGQEFPHRQVAKDALLAGNDLLMAHQFSLQPTTFEAQIANLRDTLTWFQERYVTDPAFQQRVDDAVLRILQLKLRLYDGDFSLENILVDADSPLAGREQNREKILEMAQSALTLIAPSVGELQERMPRAPGPEDQILIFTDVRQARQCASCPPQPYIAVDSLEQRILALYGPLGSAQIGPGQIISFSYSDLKEFLAAGPGPIAPPTAVPPVAPEDTQTPDDEPSPSSTPGAIYSPAFQVQSALQSAEWIVFASLDITPSVPQSDALRQFLAQRPDVARDKRTIVFAYNAPYYLDTTEISKLTAYYGVYSKIDAFIDASVRTLFQEIPAPGALPVNVNSIDYNLLQATQPDPDQVIDLFVVRDGSPQSPPSEQPLELVVGDTLHLRTGVINDHNGNPVPDGTPVEFIQQDRLEGFVSVIGERPTVDGVAELDYVLEARTGQFRITAVAGEATSSQQLDIAIGDNVRVVLVTLTPSPTETPTPTPTETPVPTATPTASPTPTATSAAPQLPTDPRIGIAATEALMLLGMIFGLVMTATMAFLLLYSVGQDELTQWVGLLAWGWVGGLLAYNLFALGFPGLDRLSQFGGWAGVVTTLSGGILGLVLGWRSLDRKRRTSSRGTAAD